MRGEHFIASIIFAGSILAAADVTRAATVPLPTGPATLHLTGEIQNPFWITFGLDAQIQLLPPGGPEDPNNFYILNVSLSNGSETTAVQFAEIQGAAVENGFYGPEGPPRLLFSDAVRTLYIDPDATFFNAFLLDATLNATLPDGLYFTPGAPGISVFAQAAVADTPLPAAAPLFATGLGGLLIWRRLRKKYATN